MQSFHMFWHPTTLLRQPDQCAVGRHQYQAQNGRKWVAGKKRGFSAIFRTFSEGFWGYCMQRTLPTTIRNSLRMLACMYTVTALRQNPWRTRALKATSSETHSTLKTTYVVGGTLRVKQQMEISQKTVEMSQIDPKRPKMGQNGQKRGIWPITSTFTKNQLLP